MSRSVGFAVAALAASCTALLLSACAASGDDPTRVYQPRSMKTGSNIDPRSGDDATTDADRQRANDQGQAIRDDQNRRNMPRREGMPKG